MPILQTLVIVIDRLNLHVGRAIAWTALAMVLVQFTVVLMRYVFGVGSIWLQESVIYFHALLFMVGAGYTLLHGGHVRVDIFYREASDKYKAIVDLGGVILLLLPVCALILITAFPYVSASWRILEQSTETSGIPAVYLLKTLILVFGGLLAVQGLSLACRSLLVLMGVPVPPSPASEGHA